VMVDVINSALGVEENWGPNGKSDVKAGSKAVEVGASQIAQAQAINYTLRIFGRPPRTAACDCERAMEPALPQTLFRMTDPTLLAKLQSRTGRVAKLEKAKLPPERAVEELFLATLTRFPTAREKAEAVAAIAGAKNKNEALADVAWALVNTREFILNH